uniref:YidC/Oxa1 family membrane protein insertase n=1 Tax=Eubacterium sp. TaxID=142586 RepID=UPI004025A555
MFDFTANAVQMAMSAEGTPIFKPLYWLFGVCMEFLLSVLNNQYFVAIIIFTVLTRIVLLPANLHQQKATAKTARLTPKIQKIQKKYPDPKDRNKLNQEMNDLYAREGHNPMQMGCGPLIFQLVFLMGIVGIIYYPLSYIIGISNIGDYADELTKFLESVDYSGNYLQLGILENWAQYKDQLIAQMPELFTSERVANIDAFRSGMYLGGLDMTAIPHWKDGKIVLIPIFSLLTSLASSGISMLIQKKTNPAMAQQTASMVAMMLMMPFFSVYIKFKGPAAVGFYWIISNVVSLLQQLFIAKFFPPKKSQAKLMVENTIYRRSREENLKKTRA